MSPVPFVLSDKIRTKYINSYNKLQKCNLTEGDIVKYNGKIYMISKIKNVFYLLENTRYKIRKIIPDNWDNLTKIN